MQVIFFVFSAVWLIVGVMSLFGTNDKEGCDIY